MDVIFEKLSDWIRSLLISGIMRNLSGIFDSVNTQAANIATEGGTTPADFFRQEEEPVVYAEKDFFEKIDENGSSIQWIVPTAQKNAMEPLLVVLQPHSALEEEKPHSGEEFGFLISGRLNLHLGDKVFHVRAGESFYYQAAENHYIENPGNRPAKLVWVSSPPSF